VAGESTEPDVVRLACGAFCISIDLELLWGVWDHVTAADARACAALEREIVRRLLGLFRTHEVPVTWAFVGRLLDDAPGFDGLLGDRDCWYAPDLIDAIRMDPIEHEIATHSYGHVYFGESPAEAVRHDLARAKAVHETHGLPFRSLVFPRNQVAHLDVIAQAGIEVFRSVDAGVLEVVGRRAPGLRPLVNLVDKALPVAPPVVLPVRREHGLTELPSSLMLIGRNGLRKVVTAPALRAKLRAGLGRTVETGQLLHLWFHPSNFYTNMESQFEVLDSALSEAAELRRRGHLGVLPMSAFGSASVAAD
jgi:hypothetical protein